MTRYPFIVVTPAGRIRHVIVMAHNYNTALDKALTRHPNKFLKTKYAKIMDLLSAKEQAKKMSRDKKSKIYVQVNNSTGECICTANLAEPGHTAHDLFVNGAQSKQPLTAAPASAVKVYDGEDMKIRNVPAGSNKAAELIAKKDAKLESAKTPTKKEPVKTNKMEKVATKKVAAKKVVKKEAKAEGKPVGKLVTMAIGKVIAALKDGSQKAFNASGKPLPVGYLAKMADPKKEIAVTLVKAA